MFSNATGLHKLLLLSKCSSIYFHGGKDQNGESFMLIVNGKCGCHRILLATLHACDCQRCPAADLQLSDVMQLSIMLCPRGGGGGKDGPRDRVGTLIRNKNLESNFLTLGIRLQFKAPHPGKRF